jgi:hypothetical protein
MKALNVLFEFIIKTYATYLSVCLFGVWAKLRKATISFVVDVRSSVCMKQLGSDRKDFCEILYLSIFIKSVKNLSFIKIWKE